LVTVADKQAVEKRMLWMCLAVGSTIGGLVPEPWRANGFGGRRLGGSAYQR